MKGELCLEEKYSTARVRSLSNSSSSSQTVRPLNCHSSERLEDRGEDDGSAVGMASPAVVVVGRPILDRGMGEGNVVDSIMNSSCSS
mmetsp:Transcript_25898/g.33135  ORF Transcript_25898/g.33135 Transcript_25898/m.33135 type:complete len:87 (-) Transcript_25898:835-1095(-)